MTAFLSVNDTCDDATQSYNVPLNAGMTNWGRQIDLSGINTYLVAVTAG